MRRGVWLFMGGTQDHPRRPGYLGRGDTQEIEPAPWWGREDEPPGTRPGALGVVGEKAAPVRVLGRGKEVSKARDGGRKRVGCGPRFSPRWVCWPRSRRS